MNTKKIKELVELMNENDLTEVEVEQEGTKVRLIKRGGGMVEQVVAPAPVVAAAAVPAAQAPAQAVDDSGGAAPAAKGKEVKSPMVGTFYRSPSPEADSYVEVGDMVKEGDVLCIVEAMKMMNEVKAEFAGKIVEIPLGNAEPVEFGQTLFVIEPA